MSQVDLVLGLIGLSALLSVWFLLRFSWQGQSATKTMVKTGSVAGLALAAIVVEGSPWLIGALALAAFGDAFLSREGDKAFLAGLICFALAHLGYIALMLATGAPLAFKLPALAVAMFAAVMLAILLPRAGALRWPVAGYVAIIATMGVIAVSLPASFAFAMAAALLFMASDMILGLDRFVWSATNPVRPAVPYAVWSTYWLAQLLFLFAFALERSV